VAKRRVVGGVFGEIDRLRDRFEDDKKAFKKAVKERLGASRALRVDDIFYLCVWKGVKYRALSPAALLEKLPTRAAKPAEAPGE
jgi:hypothetical protein